MGTSMSLTQKLLKLEEKTKKKTYAKELSDLAMEAIFKGVGSPEWEKYMKEVVGPNSPKHLARLMLKDDKKTDEWTRRNSAYIVTNAICGTGTWTKTHDKVNDGAFSDLDDEPLE